MLLADAKQRDNLSSAGSETAGRTPEVRSAFRRVRRAKGWLQVSLLAADLVAGGVVLWAVEQWGQAGAGADEQLTGPWGLSGAILLLSWVIGLFWGGLYTLRPPRPVLIWAWQLGRAVGGGTLATVAVLFLVLPDELLPRGFYLLSAVMVWGCMG